MSTASFLLSLAIILVGARLAGRLSLQVGLPAVFGELLLGLMVGPALLGWLHPTEVVRSVADLGVIVLMFIAGLETDLHGLRRVGASSLWTAIGGVVLPFAAAVGLGIVFNLTLAQSLFVAAALTATSVSISAQTLRELGHLRSRIGATILGAAVIDDVLGMIVLAVVVGLVGMGSSLVAILKMIGFFGVAFLLGRRVINLVARWIARFHPGVEGLALVMALVLIVSWAAEEVGGVAAITGAYLVGILIAQTELKAQVTEWTLALGYGLLVPVFFVAVGLEAEGLNILSPFVLILLALAILTKIAGCGIGARLSGCTPAESLRIGTGMVARGEVALVIASLGIKLGFITPPLYSAIVLMALVTTLVTPVLLKISFAEPRPALESAVEPAEIA
jgi:Kef-type K+ transport system membrane component KefB